jgi:hypothetical protein
MQSGTGPLNATGLSTVNVPVQKGQGFKNQQGRPLNQGGENQKKNSVKGSISKEETALRAKSNLLAEIVSVLHKTEKLLPVPQTKAKKHRNRKRKTGSMSKFMRQDTEVNAVREFVLSEPTMSVDEKAVKLAELAASTEAFNMRQVEEGVTHAHNGMTNFLRQDTEVNDLRIFLLADEGQDFSTVNAMKLVLNASNATFITRQNVQLEKDAARDAAYPKADEDATPSLQVDPGVLPPQMAPTHADGFASSDEEVEGGP